MGMDVDIYVYNFENMVETLLNHSDVNDNKEFLEKLLKEFGEVHGEEFFLVCNDYYSDSGYSAYYELFDFLDRRYSPQVSSILWDLDKKEMLGSANADEVAEKLGIELPYEEEE